MQTYLLIVGHRKVGDIQIGVVLITKSLQALVVRDLSLSAGDRENALTRLTRAHFASYPM